MSFFKPSQEKRDAAFLKAAKKYKVRKALRLIEKGANPDARDEQGNTAFHLMARENPLQHDCKFRVNWKEIGFIGFNTYAFNADYAEFFIKTLCEKGLDINDENNEGRTCLYETSKNNISVRYCEIHDLHRVFAKDLMEIFQKCGARTDSSVAPEPCPQEIKTPEVPEKNTDSWKMISESEIAHIETKQTIGYKITEIFNFDPHRRSYTKYAVNLETKVEAAPLDKSFDEFVDLAPLRFAYNQLIAAGGKADENVIYNKIFLGRSSDKDIGKPRQ